MHEATRQGGCLCRGRSRQLGSHVIHKITSGGLSSAAWACQAMLHARLHCKWEGCMGQRHIEHVA